MVELYCIIITLNVYNFRHLFTLILDDEEMIHIRIMKNET